MTALHQSLVTDLISEDLQMLWSHEEPPRLVSIFTAPTPNLQVHDAQERLISALSDICGEHIWLHRTLYMPFLGQEGVHLNDKSLVLVLQYQTEAQRVLELTLSPKVAKLHFHKRRDTIPGE